MKNARLIISACELCTPVLKHTRGIHDAIKILRLLQEVDTDGGPTCVVYALLETLKRLRVSYAPDAPHRKQLTPATQAKLHDTCREVIASLLEEAKHAANMDGAMRDQARDMSDYVKKLNGPDEGMG